MSKATTVLLASANRIAGELMTAYLLKNYGTEEQRKSVDAATFMESIFSGNVRAEWNLEDDPRYKEYTELLAAINTLEEAYGR